MPDADSRNRIEVALTPLSRPRRDPVRYRKLRWRAQGLVDHTEPLTHFDETLHRRGIGVGVQLEFQRDIGEADRRLAVDAERAARVPMTLRDHPRVPQLHAHSGSDRANGHARAGDQRLQQHVGGAGQSAVPTGSRMQTGIGIGAP